MKSHFHKHFAGAAGMHTFAAIGTGLLIAAAGFSVAPAAWADEVNTIEETLAAIRAERAAVSEENRAREARFTERRNEQKAMLTEVGQQVDAAEKASVRLEDLRNKNDLELTELRAQLAERQGEFGELFGAARAAAADLNEQLGVSLVSAQFRGRGEALREVAQSDSLPTVEQLEGLWNTLMQEMAEQGKLVTFTGNVIGTDNQPETRSVTRIGPFTAFSDGEYLIYQSGALKALVRQPGGGATAAAERVENHKGDGYVAGVIDPSLGTLLGLTVEMPTFTERLAQGGGIGYAIVALAVLGVLFALYKWVRLTIIGMKVRAQMRSEQASQGNPLGRVMMAYEENRNVDIETLQLKLDDAVLKELPALESGLSLVKVLAAVAPLMGLLGTVIGMIVTFQAITLFGTGDPKLMAGGISQALVTTVQGLIAAIPLLVLHAFASGTSRRLSQLLEEQSAGMVAAYAEQQRA